MRDYQQYSRNYTLYKAFSSSEVFCLNNISEKVKTEAIQRLIPGIQPESELFDTMLKYIDTRIRKIHCVALCTKTNPFLQDLMREYPDVQFNQTSTIVISLYGKIIEQPY